MKALLPVVLFALAGLFAGGAWSLHRQGARRTGVVVTGLLAAVALAGGILWLVPAGR